MFSILGLEMDGKRYEELTSGIEREAGKEIEILGSDIPVFRFCYLYLRSRDVSIDEWKYTLGLTEEKVIELLDTMLGMIFNESHFYSIMGTIYTDIITVVLNECYSEKCYELLVGIRDDNDFSHTPTSILFADMIHEGNIVAIKLYQRLLPRSVFISLLLVFCSWSLYTCHDEKEYKEKVEHVDEILLKCIPHLNTTEAIINPDISILGSFKLLMTKFKLDKHIYNFLRTNNYAKLYNIAMQCEKESKLL